MDKYKIKIITGFRQDQHYTIDANEAHKAYYLFLHPTERGVFKNGVALRGDDIKQIDPDFHATMGWNPTHDLDDDDWNEIRGKNVDRKLREICAKAQEVAKLPNISRDILDAPLSENVKLLPEKPEQKQINEATKLLADKMKV